ncbi:MAG: hypothetical protein Q7U57_06000 [Methylovulum sp.]|nr:hypothetical protein [Methylovulum sp.]
MKTLLWLPAVLLTLHTASAAVQQPDNVQRGPGVWVLSQKVFDSVLEITASRLFAGAVSSIRFRGKEFIDAADNGREFQSASFFDGMGACYNPTEAGAQNDKGKTTSSLLLDISVNDHIMETTTQMAFWTPPKTRYRKPKANKTHGKDYCGARPDLLYSQNETVLSKHILHKQITVGVAGLANVIDYRVQYDVPEAHQEATFEALSAHLPNDFSRVDVVDPNGRLLPAPGEGEQALPVILSTPDGRYAMGVYSPMLPKARSGYGRFIYPSTSKWSCVFREQAIKPGRYSYRCLAVIGTREEVRQAMVELPGRLGK